MSARLASISYVVREYDEAIAYFTNVLGFTLLEDTPLSGDKRWVMVGLDGGGANILLARAANEAQTARVGDQTGGRVFLFVHCDDFDERYARLRAAGVQFVEGPRQEDYGRVAVFVDLYGNKWDLIERAQ